MNTILRKAVLATLLVAFLLVVAIGAGLVSLDISFLKDRIHKELDLQTGYSLDVKGALRLRLGTRPELTAREIALSDGQRLLATADVAYIRLGLWNSLRGEIDIRRFQVDGLAVPYCESGGCFIAWPESGGRVFGQAPLGQAMEFSVKGAGPAGEASLECTSVPLNQMLDRDDPVPIAAEFSIPDSDFPLQGRLEGYVEPGIARVDHLKGNFADVEFDLAGSVRWEPERPQFEIRGELGNFSYGEWLQPSMHDDGEAFMDLALSPAFQILQRFDAAADLLVRKIGLGAVSLEDLRLQARLENGRVEVGRLSLSINGQTLAATGMLDTADQCPAFEADWRLDGLDTDWLQRLSGKPLPVQFAAGRAIGSWQSCGETVQDHRDTMLATFTATDIAPRSPGADASLWIDWAEGRFGWRQPARLRLEAVGLGEVVSGEISCAPLETLFAGQDWALDARLAGAGAGLELAGQAALGQPEDNASFDLAVRLDAPEPGRLTRLAGFEPGEDLPLLLAARVQGDLTSYLLEVSEARLGRSDLVGRIEWADSESGEPVMVQLRSGVLALDEIGQWLPAGEVGGAKSNRPAEPGRDWPPVDLQWRADSLQGGTFDARDARFDGTIHSLGVKDARFGLTVFDKPVEGLLDLDFAQTPASLAFDFGLQEPDIGGLLTAFGLEKSPRVHARNVEVHARTQGESWTEWVENVQAEALVQDLVWNMDSHDEDGESTLKIASAQLDLRPGADSELQGQGVFDAMPLSLRLRLPTVKTVLDKTRPMPFQLGIGTDLAIFHLEGKLDRRATARLQSDLVLTAELMDQKTLPGLSRLFSPRADFRVETGFSLADRHARLEGLMLSTGQSRIGGNVDLRGDYETLAVEVKLSAPYLETEDLVPLVARWKDDSVELDEQPVETETAVEGNLVSVIRRELRALDFVFFDIGVDVEELHSAGDLLGRGSLAFNSDREHVGLEIETDGPGGAISVGYRSDILADGLDMTLNLQVERLEFGGLMRLFEPESTASGTLFANALLSSRVGREQRVLEKLEGHVDLLAFPREVGAAWLDLWASNLVFALLSAGEAADKKMNCLAARFEVGEGVMETKQTLLDTTDIIVRARGEIDLARGWIDLLLTPQAKRERFLSAQTPIELNGPLDDFEVGIEAGGILGTLVRWYYGLIYVPWKWLTGERFPADGLATCFAVMDLPPSGAQP
jgi:hypothetical protein